MPLLMILYPVDCCVTAQGNCECWLEFQRIPKDTWLKEIETAAKSIKKEPPIHQSSSSTPRVYFYYFMLCMHIKSNSPCI